MRSTIASSTRCKGLALVVPLIALLSACGQALVGNDDAGMSDLMSNDAQSSDANTSHDLLPGDAMASDLRLLDAMPGDAMPVDGMPVDAMIPVDGMPVDAMIPVDGMPVDGMPGDGPAADMMSGDAMMPDGGRVAPRVILENPLDQAANVDVATLVEATFSEAMVPGTITQLTFTLKQGLALIPGAVSYAGTKATFKPAANLLPGTTYTATVTTGATNLAGTPLAADVSWSFGTKPGNLMSPPPVLLGSSINYVILAKSAISTVPKSMITGDLGLSPAAATFATGFSLIKAGAYATSTQVVGKVYAADYDAPTPNNLTVAVLDMQTAYTDAAGRANPDYLDLGAGAIGGLTLKAGLYKWTSTVTIAGDVTISGAANDVWIFQISKDLTMSAAKHVLLAGGAKAKNIFWQVAGEASIGTTADFQGVLLSKTGITLKTGATATSRLLAQTAVVLDTNTVTPPAP